MAELLVKAIDATHPDPTKDQRGCWKRGMIVEIRPDGCIYGTAETLPTFYKIKLPLVPMDHPLLLRLTEPQQVQDGFEEDGITPQYTSVRRRACWLKHLSIPLAARNKLASTGELIIKANPAYDGPYDYTWAQVKNYFWDDDRQGSVNIEM